MPGLVDTHSHIAGPAGGDASAPIQPDVRVLDSVNVRSTRHQARAGRRHHDGQHHAGLGPPAERADALPEAAAGRHDRRLAHHAAGRPHRRRHEDGQRHQLDPHARRPVSRHARQVGGAGARAVRQGAGVPRQAARGRRRRDQEAGARSGDGGAGRSARRQAHRALPHAPSRRHHHGAAAGRGVRLQARAAARVGRLEGRRRDRQGRRVGLDHHDRFARAESSRPSTSRSRPAACWKRPASTSASTPTTTSPTRGSSCDRRAWPCARACRATRRCTR